MVRTRILFGSLMIALLVGVAMIDARLSRAVDLSRGAVGAIEWFQRGGPTTGVVLLLALAGCRELLALLRLRGIQPPRAPCYLGTTALVLTPWVVACMSPAAGVVQWDGFWTLAALCGGAIASACALLARRDTTGGVTDLGGAMLALMYVGLLTSFLVRIRVCCPGPDGVWLLMIVVLVVKCTDIGAYFTGLLLGRHKMIPWISPNKTWEGAAGGTAAGALVAIVAWLIWPPMQEIWGTVQLGNLPGVLVFGVALAIAGQIGDLVESMIKRSANSKDAASLIPTFGGVLDVLDALLLGVPVACLILMLQHRSTVLASLDLGGIRPF